MCIWNLRKKIQQISGFPLCIQSPIYERLFWTFTNDLDTYKNVESKYDTRGTQATVQRSAGSLPIANINANVSYYFLRYRNDELRNHTNHRCKHKTWTGEDNRLALHSYFRSNPAQRGYMKTMIEIW